MKKTFFILINLWYVFIIILPMCNSEIEINPLGEEYIIANSNDKISGTFFARDDCIRGVELVLAGTGDANIEIVDTFNNNILYINNVNLSLNQQKNKM